MKIVSSAGSAPMIIISRQPECATSRFAHSAGTPIPSNAGPRWSMSFPNPNPTTAVVKKPTFEAAPISPASKPRDLSGQISMTSATPSDHSPPMPSAEMKRNRKTCCGEEAIPHNPMKTA